MRSKVTSIAGTSTLAAVLALAVGPGSAAAATVSTADVGSNIGTWLSNLGGDLLIPIAGVFGLAAFFRRDVGHAVTIVVIAVIVGIFIYYPSGAESMIKSVASTFTTGK